MLWNHHGCEVPGWQWRINVWCDRKVRLICATHYFPHGVLACFFPKTPLIPLTESLKYLLNQ